MTEKAKLSPIFSSFPRCSHLSCYSSDSLAANLPLLTLWCCSWGCDSANISHTALPDGFLEGFIQEAGGGTSLFSSFHLVSVPSVAVCPSLHVLLATVEPASGTPQKYSSDGVPTMSEHISPSLSFMCLDSYNLASFLFSQTEDGSAFLHSLSLTTFSVSPGFS